jgi:hypothetical protein
MQRLKFVGIQHREHQVHKQGQGNQAHNERFGHTGLLKLLAKADV